MKPREIKENKAILRSVSNMQEMVDRKNNRKMGRKVVFFKGMEFKGRSYAQVVKEKSRDDVISVKGYVEGAR